MDSEHHSKVAIGRTAEDRAARHLEANGLIIEAQNVRLGSLELDLVARDGDVLVFVEVKKRSSARYGGAAASVTSLKRSRLTQAAQRYLKVRGGPPPRCRFDVVTIDGKQEDLAWHRAAFVAGAWGKSAF